MEPLLDAFERELSEQAEQGSPVWFDIRAGRFTSSEGHRLMKSGKRPMTVEELNARPKSGPGSSAKMIDDPRILSDDTLTYIRQKVAEVLTGQVKEKTWSHATGWGDDWEPHAAEFFAKVRGVELEPIGFKAIGDHAGGTCDRKVKGKSEFVEIKCPYDSANQVGYLSLVDQFDLKRENPEYYWQCMWNLYFGEYDLCHFATFDPRMKEDKHKLFVMPITPIASEFDLINAKLESAIKEKLYLLNSLK